MAVGVKKLIRERDSLEGAVTKGAEVCDGWCMSTMRQSTC